MLKGVGHVGIAVKDIEKTLAALTELLGVPMPPIKDVPEKRARVALLELGPIGLELVQDDSDDGALAKFVREKGDGLHHICVLSDQIEADVEALRERGVEMAHTQPAIGLRGKKIAFAKPSAANGIVFEFSEP